MADENQSPIHGPSWNSPQYSAAMRPEPSWERLNSPSSRVWVKNTSEAQTHIVVDRFNVGHELRPGERREMEMLDEEIATFQEHRLPGRFYPGEANTPGLPKPPHAILIEGVPSMIEAKREAINAKQAELTRIRKEQLLNEKRKL